LGVAYFKDRTLARAQRHATAARLDQHRRRVVYRSDRGAIIRHTLGFFVEQTRVGANRLSLGAAARWDRLTRDLGGSRTQVYPRVDAAWTLPVAGGPTLDRLRLRAAYGRAGCGGSRVARSCSCPIGFAKPEPAGETRSGPTQGFGRSGDLGATYYHKSVGPILVVPLAPSSGGVVYRTEHAGPADQHGP